MGDSPAYNVVGGKIVFRSKAIGVYDAAKIQWFRDKTTNWGTALAFYTNPDGGSLVESLRIDQSQRIGIGTQTPNMKMHIKTAINEIDGLNLTVDGTNDDGGVGLFLWSFRWKWWTRCSR